MTMRSFLLGATALVSCAFTYPASAQTATPEPIKVKSVEFTSTPAPANAMEMAAPYTRSSAVVTLTDGSKKTFPLQYEVMHRSGDYLGGGYAGLVVDKAGKPLLQSAPDKKGNIARGPFFAPGPDGTSMLAAPNAKVSGVKGQTVFLINQVEYDTEAPNADPAKDPVALYGALPMGMNLTILDQDPATGALKPVKVSNIDFSAVGGLWIPCNSSVTPWMTHLGSEEYEPDAATFGAIPPAISSPATGSPPT